MLELLLEHVGDILIAVEILVLSFFGKSPFKNLSKTLVKQEKKVAKDYAKLKKAYTNMKVDESVLEELKKGDEE